MASADEVKEVVADIIGADPSEIETSTDLYSFPDFDSIEVLSLLVALNDIGVDVDQGQISNVVTFGDLLKVAKIDA